MLEGSQGKLGGLKAKKADAIPKPSLFMMGNGKPVQPSRSGAFIDQAVIDSLDFDVEIRVWFQLGCAAMADMIRRGTFDFSENPSAVIDRAWHDVHNITTEPNMTTDIMKAVCE